MPRLLRLYFRLIFLQIRTHMEYRLDFWIGIGGIALRQAGALIFIWALFSTIPAIVGWSLWEVALLYALVTIPQGFSALFLEGSWRLRLIINQGQFDQILTRPVSPLLQLITQTSSIHGLGSAALGFIVLLLTLNQLDLAWDFGHVIYLVLILLSSTILTGAINLMTNCIGFWDPSADGSFPFLMSSLSEFARYPITTYPPVFQTLFTWVLPLAMTSYYPGLLLLVRPEVSLLSYLAPFSGWIVAGIAILIWRWSMQHYQGVGH